MQLIVSERGGIISGLNGIAPTQRNTSHKYSYFCINLLLHVVWKVECRHIEFAVFPVCAQDVQNYLWNQIYIYTIKLQCLLNTYIGHTLNIKYLCITE